MRMYVSVGCFLPGIALRRGWLEIIKAKFANEELGLAGLPLRTIVDQDDRYHHFEWPWNEIRFDGAKMVYEPKPDLRHRVAFPEAEVALEWCDYQVASGGHWSVHEIPEDLRLEPHQTVEINPDSCGDGRQMHEVAAKLAEANKRLDVIAWDTYHTRRDEWHDDGPWRREMAPYIGVIHLQPDRDNPYEFEMDCHDGATSNTLYGLRQLVLDHGVSAPIVVEVSPEIVRHNHGWRALFSPDAVCDHVIEYANKVRRLLKA